MSPELERIVQRISDGDLPEIWRVPNIERFSPRKNLYDYQQDALRKAARALCLYFGQAGDALYSPSHKTPDSHIKYKMNLAHQYGFSFLDRFAVEEYERPSDRKNDRQNAVFHILSEFIPVTDEKIRYEELVNRMCFWMATGSGKTLVMIKLIEYLHHLKTHATIPAHNILVLAPSDHLLGQIRKTVEEFNEAGLNINLLPLRESGKPQQSVFGNSITVYYHRSDNVSDEQTTARVDYRRYENDGRWYILLDEAHKGNKEDSKRQAYYAVMARQGFLFNFSATFTSPEDIATTVKKYNLEEFIKNGHGKNIYLNRAEYETFRNAEINHLQRKKIVLKSLVALAHTVRQANNLRTLTGRTDLYHSPLMLTLVNRVNTAVENDRNDLWAFFQTLREIATGEIDEQLFREIRSDLSDEWNSPTLLFRKHQKNGGAENARTVARMKVTDLREAVFMSRRRGALQFICSKDNKELAFQMKNADAPFALIRIGDTSKWRNHLLTGFEETRTLQKTSFFDSLEHSSITILMGSRTFFESWDSNRPNVINFINIGSVEAKKFVVQSVGRGVRIEAFPGQRQRHDSLPKSDLSAAIQPHADLVWPLETLFLFATNKKAVRSVLEGLETEESAAFMPIKGFKKADRPKVNGKEMALLVPEYKEARQGPGNQAKFAISSEALERFQAWLRATPDSVFMVRDGLSSKQIATLRESAQGSNTQDQIEKNYASLPFLQKRLLSHLEKTGSATDRVRHLDGEEDIIHFRQVRVRMNASSAHDLQQKLIEVAEGTASQIEKKELARQYAAGEISAEEFDRRFRGATEASFQGEIEIKHIQRHYYLPLVIATHGRADFIRHIVRERSEVLFLQKLEEWLTKNQPSWDAWMFSKVDETCDRIYLPYYDTKNNEYRRFFPDFIFWMCKGKKYQIVFVDPKGTEHTSAYRKIDGYRDLFETDCHCKKFQHRKSEVQVRLLMFNPEAYNVPSEYEHFWTDTPGEIFSSSESCAS